MHTLALLLGLSQLLMKLFYLFYVLKASASGNFDQTTYMINFFQKLLSDLSCKPAPVEGNKSPPHA